MTTAKLKKTVLCIGLSDPTGGTGIQADIKTLLSLGLYAGTVITSITVQDSKGLNRNHPLPSDIVIAQFETAFAELQPAVVKIGYIENETTITAIGDFLSTWHDRLKIVVDPVMTNRAGQILNEKKTMDALKRSLALNADVLMPNIPEAEVLTGLTIRDLDDMKHAAEMLRTLGARTVIIKGGALNSGSVQDVIADDHDIDVFDFQRLDRRQTRGAGTILSSALAGALASGYSVREAYVKVRRFLQQAIATSPIPKKGATTISHVRLLEEQSFALFRE